MNNSLDCILELENKVEKAISYINTLKKENSEIRQKLSESELEVQNFLSEIDGFEKKLSDKNQEVELTLKRLESADKKVKDADKKINELLKQVEVLKSDYGLIEEGLIRAISKLDTFSDLILDKQETNDNDNVEDYKEYTEVSSELPTKENNGFEEKSKSKALPDNELDIF